MSLEWQNTPSYLLSPALNSTSALNEPSPTPSYASSLTSSSTLARSAHSRQPPFILPDPVDLDIPLYDPRGLTIKTRRPSTSSHHSRTTTEGSNEQINPTTSNGAEDQVRTRESSADMVMSPPSMSGIWPRGTSPALMRKDDEGDAVMQEPQTSTNNDTLLSPIQLDTITQGQPLATKPSSLSSTSDRPSVGRGRASLNRLRVGSLGAPTQPVAMATEPSHSPAPSRPSDSWGSPKGIPITRSRASSASTASNTTGTGPMSPAASFLSSFSPNASISMDQSNGRLSALLAGDEEGFVIGGYTLGQELGTGAFGVVRQATRVEGSSSGEPEQVAVKIVRHHGGHAGIASAPGFREPVSSVGEALRRSASGYRQAPRDRRMSNFERERIRSTSTPVPGHMMDQDAHGQSAFASLRLTDQKSSSTSSSNLSSPDPEVEQEPSFIESLITREIHIWQQLARHPNILNLLFTVRTDDFTYIFMPLCDGGTLLEFLNSKIRSRSRRASTGPSFSGMDENAGAAAEPAGLPPHVVLPIFSHLVEGLQYLHTDARVLHRDIKLENILYNARERLWKLSDFGLAESMMSPHLTLPQAPASPAKSSINVKKRSTDSTPSKHGTGSITPGLSLASLSRTSSVNRPEGPHHHRHLARQHITSDQTNGTSSSHAQSDREYEAINEHLHPAGSLPYSSPEQMASPTPILSPSIDIWALGCVLYALLVGSLPITDDFEPRLRDKIVKGRWGLPSHVQLDDEVLQVLYGCLTLDPNLRWSIQQIRDSQWVRSYFDPPPTPQRGRQQGARLLRKTSAVEEDSSSSSRSVSMPRRSTRSTSRSSAAVKHLGISNETRSLERQSMEHEERKMRWDRAREERRGRETVSSNSSSRSESRGREASVEPTGGRGRSRAREGSRNRSGSREGLRSGSRSQVRLRRVDERPTDARPAPY